MDHVPHGVGTVYFPHKFSHKQCVGRNWILEACCGIPGSILYLEVVFMEIMVRRFICDSGGIINHSGGTNYTKIPMEKCQSTKIPIAGLNEFFQIKFSSVCLQFYEICYAPYSFANV